MKVEWWLPEMAGWGWGRKTALLFNEYRALDWVERKVLGWIVMMVVHNVNACNTYGLCTLNG